MIWSIEDPRRSRNEREGLDALASRVDWLIPRGWRVDDSIRLVWDADILASGTRYPISLRYPNHFPHSPPVVLPRGQNERWSTHQYGPGGELCLEFGPDNWHPDISGADMVESAYRLLQGENPAPGESAIVATRHATTLGQDMRGAVWRFVITRALAAKIKECPRGAPLDCEFVGMFHSEAFIFFVRSIVFPGGELWTDLTAPKALDIEEYERKGLILCLPAGVAFPSTDSATRFRAEIAGYGVELSAATTYVVLVKADLVRAFYLWNDTVTAMSVIPPQAEANRVDVRHTRLASKLVGIVGCGSLGSKLTVMLARSGVGRFMVVDDDLMLPDNFVRHDLDWRDVGTHKADSVARRIQLVNPAASCTTRKDRLGGQESSGSIESLVESLANCDLLVDATADPRVFNYLCAAVAIGKKPFVWAEVFGGGFGGMIARHRPAHEPDPASMRRTIVSWCAERNIPVERTRGCYDNLDGEEPMIADDADVSVIASHAARLAIDQLIAPEESAYPSSVYMIGLAKRWIFNQPFETYPIDVGPNTTMVGLAQDPEESEAEAKKIVALFLERIHGNSSAGEDREAPAE